MFGEEDGTRKASPNPNASLYEPWIAAVGENGHFDKMRVGPIWTHQHQG